MDLKFLKIGFFLLVLSLPSLYSCRKASEPPTASISASYSEVDCYRPIRLISVYDGDTIKAEIDLGFDLKYTDNIRLVGINTPEIRSKDPEEKKRGYEARDYLKSLLEAHRGDLYILLHSRQRGKYGRPLGQILIFENGEITNINDAMISAGYSEPYFP